MDFKSKRGSITLFVLVSCLFFIASVACVNMYIQSKQSAIDREYRQIKATYEKDINNMDSIYEELSSQNNLSVDFGIPEINQAGKKIYVKTYVNLEYLNIKIFKYGWYYTNEEQDINDLQSNDVINWTYVENLNGENEFVASTSFTQNSGYYYLCVMINNQEIWFEYPINISKTKFTGFYGDFIDYDVDLGINSDQNLQTNSNSQSNYEWKIFYQDEDTTYIIAKDYVKWSNVTNQATLNNSPASGNPYALDWSNSSIPKTGINDIFYSDNEKTTKLANKYLNGWKSIMANNNITTNTNDNAKITALLMDTEIWKSLTNNNSSLYAIGCPTIEMWVNSWNDKYPDQQIYLSNDINGIGYNIGSNNNTDVSYTIDNSWTGFNDKMYFPHDASVSKCEGYCIASPSSVSNKKLIRVDYNRTIGNPGNLVQHGSLRPVVCIPSSFKIFWNSNDKIWHIMK